MRDLINIVKIGGNIIDDEQGLASFLKNFGAITGKKILVHGGGKLATKLAGRLGVEQQMIDGRRITDEETLKIVTMVYAGYINKNIVAQLQANGCNAIGVCGADANLVPATKRNHPTIDYGYAGDVNSSQLTAGSWQLFLDNGLCPVVAPITHDTRGKLLNTNADTMAQEIAKALSVVYQVNLIYSFEKNGVLLDVNDDSSVISKLDLSYYEQLKKEQKIFAGMIPKLDNAFAALNSGVQKVIIGKAEALEELITGSSGTSITHE
ncbi:MAG TPA: acetylglutamate kinase [Flavitalea sp.]|nr:acetylglutamate kinase [Flavitalea sp.]